MGLVLARVKEREVLKLGGKTRARRVWGEAFIALVLGVSNARRMALAGAIKKGKHMGGRKARIKLACR